MKVALSLAKNILAPLGLTAAMLRLMEVYKRKFMVQGRPKVQELN